MPLKNTKSISELTKRHSICVVLDSPILFVCSLMYLRFDVSYFCLSMVWCVDLGLSMSGVVNGTES